MALFVVPVDDNDCTTGDILFPQLQSISRWRDSIAQPIAAHLIHEARVPSASRNDLSLRQCSRMIVVFPQLPIEIHDAWCPCRSCELDWLERVLRCYHQLPASRVQLNAIDVQLIPVGEQAFITSDCYDRHVYVTRRFNKTSVMPTLRLLARQCVAAAAAATTNDSPSLTALYLSISSSPSLPTCLQPMPIAANAMTPKLQRNIARRGEVQCDNKLLPTSVRDRLGLLRPWARDRVRAEMNGNDWLPSLRMLQVRHEFGDGQLAPPEPAVKWRRVPFVIVADVHQPEWLLVKFEMFVTGEDEHEHDDTVLQAYLWADLRRVHASLLDGLDYYWLADDDEGRTSNGRCYHQLFIQTIHWHEWRARRRQRGWASTSLERALHIFTNYYDVEPLAGQLHDKGIDSCSALGALVQRRLDELRSAEGEFAGLKLELRRAMVGIGLADELDDDDIGGLNDGERFNDIYDAVKFAYESPPDASNARHACARAQAECVRQLQRIVARPRVQLAQLVALVNQSCANDDSLRRRLLYVCVQATLATMHWCSVSCGEGTDNNLRGERAVHIVWSDEDASDIWSQLGECARQDESNDAKKWRRFLLNKTLHRETHLRFDCNMHWPSPLDLVTWLLVDCQAFNLLADQLRFDLSVKRPNVKRVAPRFALAPTSDNDNDDDAYIYIVARADWATLPCVSPMAPPPPLKRWPRTLCANEQHPFYHALDPSTTSNAAIVTRSFGDQCWRARPLASSHVKLFDWHSLMFNYWAPDKSIWKRHFMSLMDVNCQSQTTRLVTIDNDDDGDVVAE